MRRLEQALITTLCVLGGTLTSSAAADDEPAFRFRAPIHVQQPGAFVQLPLAPSAYAKTAQGALTDLRIVDADGARVPFAVLAPRASQSQTTEQLRPATLYALPKRPSTSGAWQSPVEVSVQGDRISVKRRSGSDTSVPAASAGWLIDLGERKPTDPMPRAVRLSWSGPAEFSVAYDFDSSDDLREWRRGSSGQVMALASTAGPLTQPNVALPEGTGRFVRLVWADAGAAPVLTAADAVWTERRDETLDPPAELEVAASPEPAAKRARDADAERALYFDLGATLPVVELDLRLAPGTRIAPVRVETRATPEAAWRHAASTVFYRLERDGKLGTSPPLALRANVRAVRVLPDERAAALDSAQTQLVSKVQLASIVFASQGKPPLTLLAGSPDARASALPVATLVPALDDERPRFGKATLGEWTEAADVAKAMQAGERWAALRPALLWAVLLAGVAALAWMVWRLAKGATPDR